jgi:hypothetical protein
MAYLVLLVVGAWLLYAWDKTKRSKDLMRARAVQREVESTESPIVIPPVLPLSAWSEDGQMKTERAKALYRDYLIKYGRITGGPLSRRDVSDALEEFSDSIGLHRERLTEEVQFLVEDGRSKVDLSSRISALHAQIAELPRGSSRRRELDDELELLREMLRDERSDAALEVAEANAALAAFRKDKREFLIDAINTRFHGHDWRNR